LRRGEKSSGLSDRPLRELSSPHCGKQSARYRMRKIITMMTVEGNERLHRPSVMGYMNGAEDGLCGVIPANDNRPPDVARFYLQIGAIWLLPPALASFFVTVAWWLGLV
jgi:hypothetical protein